MPRGGARPGAGRKRGETLEQQLARRDQLAARLTDETWNQICDTAFDQAAAGDHHAREWVSAWILGAKPKEVDVYSHHDPVTTPVILDNLPWMDEEWRRQRAIRLAREAGLQIVAPEQDAPVIDGKATPLPTSRLLVDAGNGHVNGNGHGAYGR